MTDPTLTISIDRTSLDLPPLEFSAADDSIVLGIMSYQQPALQWQIGYAPDSADRHGSVPLSAAYQQAILGWDWIADHAATEADAQAAFEEVAAALAQFRYPITTQVSGAPAQVWTCDPGSVVPSERSYEDLLELTQVFAVTVPVYPIAGS